MKHWRRWTPIIGMTVSAVAVVVTSIRAEWPAAVASGLLGISTFGGFLAERHPPKPEHGSVSAWTVARLVWPALLLGALLLVFGAGNIVKGSQSSGSVRNGELTVGVMFVLFGVILYFVLGYYGKRMINRSSTSE